MKTRFCQLVRNEKACFLTSLVSARKLSQSAPALNMNRPHETADMDDSIKSKNAFSLPTQGPTLCYSKRPDNILDADDARSAVIEGIWTANAEAYARDKRHVWTRKDHYIVPIVRVPNKRQVMQQQEAARALARTLKLEADASPRGVLGLTRRSCTSMRTLHQNELKNEGLPYRGASVHHRLSRPSSAKALSRQLNAAATAPLL